MREVDHVRALHVEIETGGTIRRVGRLAWQSRQRLCYFEFDPDFLAQPLPLSPHSLKVEPGALEAPATPFAGLHGLFADSLPDGWGRKLLDRSLERRGYDNRLMTPLDRLAFVGTRGMGALRYLPESPLKGAPATGQANLDWLANEARLVEEDVPTADVDRLREADGSSGGVRPKVVVAYDPVAGTVRYDDGGPLPPGFSHWLVKFRAKEDPAEIGAEEYAYGLMARDAGVDMPEVALMRTGQGAYFAVRRFDRDGGQRLHVHTAAGLVNADYRLAGSIEYETLLRITRGLTRDVRHIEQVFRRMVFNVLAHNRDDHAKNHAFLMLPDGSWVPSPAYDITFSSGPAGEHNLTLGGEGAHPSLPHILAVAKDIGLSAKTAKMIHEEVKTVVDRWPDFASRAGLSDRRTAAIDHVLNGRGRKPEPDDMEAASSPSP